MKKVKQLSTLVLTVVFLLTMTTIACSQDKKVEIIKIKTSAVCGMCKDRLEGGLAFEKGVKDVSLDDETKILTIKYNTKSTSPDELRKKISKLGYDADDVAADKAAYEKLPACCKKDVPKH